MMHREFWEAGYRIFPLWEIDKHGNCTCGKERCIGAGKHPRVTNWQQTPEWDEEQIEAMEQYGSLATGYGVLCKGLLVVDVDARNGGIESYERLLGSVPEIAGAGLVVNTGSGGGSRHLYFWVDENVSFLSHLPQYPGVDFRSGSSFVVGPGSRHKSGKVYSTADGSPYDLTEIPDGLRALLQRPERHRADYNGSSLDVSHQDIADMLSCILNNDLHYDDWVKIGMSIHQATGGTGYEIWRTWSATSPKHDETLMQARWHSFGKSANPVTIGTLIFHAEQNGWQMPVTFSADESIFNVTETDTAAEAETDDGLPFDVAGVNLKSPPGFVGEVAEWIESQNRRSRINLAVAGALVAIGNIAGLRYAASGTTTNMLAFCVAGAGSGKEAVLQGVNTIMRVANMADATHGSIKSEQEIVRNLVRHQAAFYTVDEIGIFLQKVASAQKRGGAVYLEGVIGTIMAVFTKSTEYYGLSGDIKEDVKKALRAELSTVGRKADDGEMSTADAEVRMEKIKKQLQDLRSGLRRPFLSLIGFTTPITFDGVVTYESATNGFFSRAVLFNERDNAPRSKDNFSKPDMPESIRNTIIRIATGDNYDMFENRVETDEDWIEVPSDGQAKAMLEKCRVWFDDRAKEAEGRTGLESLWLRGFEQVLKVSLILAVPSGLRTSEHVRWAFALVRRDITEKSQLVLSNTPHKEEAGDAMKMKILNMCADEDGASLGKIKQALKPRKPQEIDAALASLVAAKKLKQVDGVHKFNKKPFTKFVAI